MLVSLLGTGLSLILSMEVNFLSSHTLDAFNAMGNLVGSPPIKINETEITLEHPYAKIGYH